MNENNLDIVGVKWVSDISEYEAQLKEILTQTGKLQSATDKAAATVKSGMDEAAASTAKLKQETASYTQAREDQAKRIAQLIHEEKQDLAELKKAMKDANNPKDVKEYEARIRETENRIHSLSQKSKEFAATTVSLRTQLRKMKEQLAAMAETDPGFIKLSIEAARLEDKINDVRQRVKALASDEVVFDTVAQGAQAMAGAFAVAEGAAALLGGENEDLQKALLKVNAAMAIAMGAQQVAQNLNKDTILGQKLRVLWTNLETIAVGKATGALKVFRIALASTGIGLVVLALGALIANWDELTGALKDYMGVSRDTRTELEKHNELIEHQNKLIAAQRELDDSRLAFKRESLEKETAIEEERHRRAKEDIQRTKLSDTERKLREQTELNIHRKNISDIRNKWAQKEYDDQQKEKQDEQKLQEQRVQERFALEQLRIDNMREGRAKELAQAKLDYDKDLEQYKGHKEQIAEATVKHLIRMKKIEEELSKDASGGAGGPGSSDKTELDKEKERIEQINELRMRMMEEGTEKELEQEQLRYDQEKERLKGNLEALELLEKEHTDKVNAIHQKQAQRDLELKLQIQQSAVQGLNSLAAIFSENQDMVAKWQARIALAELAVNTGRAISNLTVSAFSPTSPVNLATGGLAGIANFATGLVAILANVAQAKQYISQGFAEGVIDLKGPGTGTSDSIPARLSKGESVMTARETTSFKDELIAMRKGREHYSDLILTKYILPELKAFDMARTTGERMAASTAFNFDDSGIRSDLRGIKPATSRDIDRMTNRLLSGQKYDRWKNKKGL